MDAVLDYAREQWLSPPEYDDPESEDDVIFEQEVVFDSEIEVSKDDWIYTKGEIGKGLPDYIYYEDGLSPVLISDRSGIVERVEDLLVNKIPFDNPGTYKLKGTALLEYHISELAYYKGYKDCGYLDGVEVNFNSGRIESLSIEKI